MLKVKRSAYMRVRIEGAYTYGQLTLDGYTKIGHRNVPLYCNTVIGTLDVDGSAVTYGTAERRMGGLCPRPLTSLMYQM